MEVFGGYLLKEQIRAVMFSELEKQSTARFCTETGEPQTMQPKLSEHRIIHEKFQLNARDRNIYTTQRGDDDNNTRSAKYTTLVMRTAPVYVNGVPISDTKEALEKIEKRLTVEENGGVRFADNCMLRGSQERVRVGKNRVNVRDLMTALFKCDVSRKKACIVHVRITNCGDNKGEKCGAMFLCGDNLGGSRGDNYGCRGAYKKETGTFVCVNPMHMAEQVTVEPLKYARGVSETRTEEIKTLLKNGVDMKAAAFACGVTEQWARRIKHLDEVVRESDSGEGDDYLQKLPAKKRKVYAR